MTKKKPSDEDLGIAERIKFMRTRELEIGTQEEFARQLGVTRGAVGNWERGQGIKRENLQKIADAFNVSFDWLANGKGTPRAMPRSIDERLNKIRLRRPDISDLIEDQIEGLLRPAEGRDRDKNQ